MVLPAHLLAAAGANFEKRAATTTWSTVVSTSYDLISEATSVTLFGYYDTTLVASDGVPVVSTIKATTLTTYQAQTSPLTNPTPLSSACLTDYWVYGRDPFYVEPDFDPTLEVGFRPDCLPTGWWTVDYYSPGICPTGYTIATSFLVSTAALETGAKCCYNSYTIGYDGYCVSYLNPMFETSTTKSDPTTTAGPITRWTVTALYTTIDYTSSVFNAPEVTGTVVTTEPTTSYTEVATSTGLTVVSGELEATVLAPPIWIRWKSTDQVVVNWLAQQPGSGNGSANGTVTPIPSPTPSPPKISAGAIAGIAVGAVAGLAFIIAALVLFLRRRKRRSTTAAVPYTITEEPKEFADPGSPTPTYVAESFPKTELDSRALSPTEYATKSPTSPPPPSHEFYAQSPSSPPPTQQYMPYRPPVAATGGAKSTELPATSARLSSIDGSTLSPHERSRSPSEWTESQLPETDMHGFMAAAPSGSTGARQSSVSLMEQQGKIKEEKARLARLQELSEMESKLEEQIQRELEDERM